MNITSTSLNEIENQENLNDTNKNEKINDHENQRNKKLLMIQNKFIKSVRVPQYFDEKLRLLNNSILVNQLKVLEERKLAQKKENVNVGLLIDYMQRVLFFF